MATSPASGWFRGTTVEGADVYTRYLRSGMSGWTVGVAIPADIVDESAMRAAFLLALGFAVTVLISGVAAYFLSRRIADPIGELAVSAQSLGAPGTRSPV